MSKKYVLICEAGWRYVRERAIEFSNKNIYATILIKGLPAKEVRDMITRLKGIDNIFIPDKIYPFFLFMYIFLNIFSGKELLLFVTKEKTHDRLIGLKSIFKKIQIQKIPA